jgi:hypothetical protein
MSKLIIKQKQAIRIICKANFRNHTGPLFAKLKILTIEQMIQLYRTKFMHSFHFKRLPLSFAETWQTNGQRHPDRALRNDDDYYIPAHRIELVKKMPLYTFPAAWNEAGGNKFNPIQHLYMKEFPPSPIPLCVTLYLNFKFYSNNLVRIQIFLIETLHSFASSKGIG